MAIVVVVKVSMSEVAITLFNGHPSVTDTGKRELKLRAEKVAGKRSPCVSWILIKHTINTNVDISP